MRRWIKKRAAGDRDLELSRARNSPTSGAATFPGQTTVFLSILLMMVTYLVGQRQDHSGQPLEDCTLIIGGLLIAGGMRNWAIQCKRYLGDEPPSYATAPIDESAIIVELDDDYDSAFNPRSANCADRWRDMAFEERVDALIMLSQEYGRMTSVMYLAIGPRARDENPEGDEARRELFDVIVHVLRTQTLAWDLFCLRGGRHAYLVTALLKDRADMQLRQDAVLAALSDPQSSRVEVIACGVSMSPLHGYTGQRLMRRARESVLRVVERNVSASPRLDGPVGAATKIVGKAFNQARALLRAID